MNVRKRVQNTLNFLPCTDRLPMVEWAAWWNLTADRWKTEGIDPSATTDQMIHDFGLDNLVCIGGAVNTYNCPRPERGPLVTDIASYQKIKPYLYRQEDIDRTISHAKSIKEAHDNGEIAVRVWLDGCFWYPRTLFGIEEHFYAFYDEPELMHMINEDLTEYNIRVVRQLFEILTPEFVGFAEDMSYNLGPMLSHELYTEFLLPYYRRIVPVIKDSDSKVLVDSDGDIALMIPWFYEAGIDGVYPLERQAGVDIVKIREQYPDFIMLGGFDKMVMNKGEAAIRNEFERIFPVMKSGGYIPSVDHQTPPGVSLEDYRIYLKLFGEYCTRAVSEVN